MARVPSTGSGLGLEENFWVFLREESSRVVSIVGFEGGEREKEESYEDEESAD